MNTNRFAGLAILCGLWSGLAGAAPVTLSYQVSPVMLDGGSNGGSSDRAYRFTYILGGDLLAGQEVDIEFDPSLFERLFNPSASSSFDVLLFQPNNPPGTSGVFSALALQAVSGPATFLVDVTYLGNGVPGSQPFSVNAFAADGSFVPLQDGTTFSDAVIPEPGALICVGSALAALAVKRLRRRRLPEHVAAAIK